MNETKDLNFFFLFFSWQDGGTAQAKLNANRTVKQRSASVPDGSARYSTARRRLPSERAVTMKSDGTEERR